MVALAGSDTLPQNLTAAIAMTSAIPTTPTAMRKYVSVIDTDFTIHAGPQHHHAQTVRREVVDSVDGLCA